MKKFLLKSALILPVLALSILGVCLVYIIFHMIISGIHILTYVPDPNITLPAAAQEHSIWDSVYNFWKNQYFMKLSGKGAFTMMTLLTFAIPIWLLLSLVRGWWRSLDQKSKDALIPNILRFVLITWWWRPTCWIFFRITAMKT